MEIGSLCGSTESGHGRIKAMKKIIFGASPQRGQGKSALDKFMDSSTRKSKVRDRLLF